MNTLATKPLFSRTYLVILAIAIITASASEFKVMPFEDYSAFRFGLGSIIFFLALLTQKVPIFITGILTGIIITIFRTITDIIYNSGTVFEHFIEHIPAALFYFIFAFIFSRVPLEKIKKQPFYLGITGTLTEIAANTFENFLASILIATTSFSMDVFVIICLVAILRSFFVVGIYSSIVFSEQKKQIQDLLSIQSDLYVESLYLQKSMDQIENLTANTFHLYKKLQEANNPLSLAALNLSQEIHELKKDSARINAGLAKIVVNEKQLRYSIEDLLYYVAVANEQYSSYLKKNIQLNVQLKDNFYTTKHLDLLAILNNLVSNAVESISESGTILIKAYIKEKNYIFVVSDNGVGVKPNEIDIIFEPGYTTKFSEEGFASTGIGLSHVKSITNHLNGHIHVKAIPYTKFTVILPLEKLL